MKNLSKNIILSILVFIQEQKKYFIQNFPKILTYGLLMSILFFSIIYLSVNFADLSILEATKDNQFFKKGESIFYGLISNIGIFLWILSLSLNLYAYVNNKKIYKIFLLGAINAAFLMIADCFDLQNSPFGNKIYFFLASSSFFVFFYCSKLSIIKNKLIILFISFSLFAAAMLIDTLQGYKNVLIPYLYSSSVEELFEFLGVFYYLFYWFEVFRKIDKVKK